MFRVFFGVVMAWVLFPWPAAVTAQNPAPPSAGAPASRQAPAPAPAVERLGPNLYRIGRMQVDTAKREVTVPGRLNPVTTLEFVACTRGGMKAYESALTLETDGVTFNTALLLIGLDKAHARVPERHFDPVPPAGDPVEIWIEWSGRDAMPGGRVPAEQLLFNQRTKQTVAVTSWVYTGSTTMPTGAYLADRDGVLIGFVHSPAPVIESVGGPGVGNYGDIVLNPNLRLAPLAPVTLTIRALKPATGGR